MCLALLDGAGSLGATNTGRAARHKKSVLTAIFSFMESNKQNVI